MSTIVFIGAAAGSAGAYDPASTYTLSNSNRTVVRTAGGDVSVAGLTTHSSGLWYVEDVRTSAPSGTFGIGNASFNKTTEQVGDTSASWGVVMGSGSTRKYHSGSASYFGASVVGAGHRVALALNLTSGKLWFSFDGVWIGDPVAGTGEAYSGLSGTFRVATNWQVAGSGGTTNFTAASQIDAAPSGYSAWE